MLAVSEEFKRIADSTQRNVKALLEVVFDDNKNLLSPVATASSYLDENHNPSQACNGRIVLTDYLAKGMLPPYMKTQQYGWASLSMSDDTGLMNEHLIIKYPAPVTFKTVWFESLEGYHPKDFTVQILEGNEWHIVATEIANEEHTWVGHLSKPYTATQIKLQINQLATAQNNARIIEFGIPSRLVLDDDSLATMNVLEEASGNSAVPIGSITSNELFVELLNDHKWFLPNNELSPFRDLLKPGIQLRPFFGLELEDESFEFIPMGRFVAYDWKPPAEALTVSVTGFDRLYQMSKEPLAKIPVLRNTTIKELLRTIFEAYGLKVSEYVIDPVLKQPIELAWLPSGSLIAGLQSISIAGNCTITTDRLDRIVVMSNYVEPEELAVLDGDINLMSLSNPYSYESLYSSVKITYKIPKESDDKEVLSLKSIVVPAGGFTLKNVAFTGGPVMRITRYRVLQRSTVRIVSMESGAWTTDITFTNSSDEAQTIDIEVHGTSVETVDAEFKVRNPVVERLIGVSTYEVDSPLIQSLKVAKTYGRSLLSYVSEQGTTYKSEIRGNPAIELLDILMINNEIDNITGHLVRPDRYTFEYDGGLTVVMEGKKPVQPTIPVFLNNGQIIIAPIRPDKVPY